MPKSILKKSNTAGKSHSPISRETRKPSPISREDRNHELALHHANLIQQRKDFDSDILISIEELIDYPQETTDPRNPAQEDISSVKERFKLFQPSDFDSVVEERNINNRCGYVLCPRRNHKENTTAKFRVSRRRGAVVETAELEKWCSEDCEKRASYIRAQLSHVPAWDRSASFEQSIHVYGETELLPSQSQPGVNSLTNGLKDLALERGDDETRIRLGTINDSVLETDMTDESNVDYSLDVEEQMGYTEGYLPRTGQRKLNEDSDEEDLDGDFLEALEKRLRFA